MNRLLRLATVVVAIVVAVVSVYVVRSGFFDAEGSSESKVPVVFRIHAPDAKSVFVAGSFNAWQRVEYRLDKKEGGIWETTVLIAPGRYEYKFVVDTLWVHDVENPIKVPAPLPYAGYNSVLEVKSSHHGSVKSL